jgi:hypothetical protein
MKSSKEDPVTSRLSALSSDTNQELETTICTKSTEMSLSTEL